MKQNTALEGDFDCCEYTPPSRRSRLAPRFPTRAEPGLGGGGVRPELATNLDSAVEESTGSRRHLASEEWPART